MSHWEKFTYNELPYFKFVKDDFSLRICVSDNSEYIIKAHILHNGW